MALEGDYQCHAETATLDREPEQPAGRIVPAEDGAPAGKKPSADEPRADGPDADIDIALTESDQSATDDHVAGDAAPEQAAHEPPEGEPGAEKVDEPDAEEITAVLPVAAPPRPREESHPQPAPEPVGEPREEPAPEPVGEPREERAPEPVEEPRDERETEAGEKADRADLLLWLHRGLTLVAIMGLIVNTRSFWATHALSRPWLALTVTGAYVAMLTCAILAFCVSRQRSLGRIDGGVLVTAIVIKGVASWTGIAGFKEMVIDEGLLMDRAARGLAEGINPYTSAWDDILPGLPTQLMDGRGVYDFGYPPLGIQMGAGMQTLFPSIVGVVAVSWLALLATALILFFVAPRPLRPVATLGVLGLGTLTAYADNAYPSLMALPLLCLSLWSWPSIGRGGRLGWTGYGRAVALGLACSIHQLGWFLALFLVAGLIVLRLGELPLGRVFLLTLRYGGTALAVFALVNLQFIVESPAQWMAGIFEPLLQHAVPHGQGLMGYTAYVTGGSGALDFYGHATKALLVALLITFAVFLRRLGPAIAVLPWLIFLVSTRSQDGYWLLTMPLWVVVLATTSRRDFAHSYTIGKSPRPLIVAGTVALFLPAAGCVAVAMTSPQPLTMRVANAVVPGHRLTGLTVEVTNNSSRAVIPSFSLAAGVTIADVWPIQTGPLSLPPHTTAFYTLLPPEKKTKDPITPTVWADSIRPANPRPVVVWRVPVDGPVYLRAVSDHPQTMSSVLVIPDWPEEHELDQ